MLTTMKEDQSPAACTGSFSLQIALRLTSRFVGIGL